jgi:hypothetical protein
VQADADSALPGYRSTRQPCLRFMPYLRLYAFSTCEKSSSTGVDRQKSSPKRAACFFRIHILDVAVEVGERAFLDPHRLAKLEQHLRTRLFDAFLTCCRIASTSFCVIGVGLLAVPPTKPVTLGVLFTRCQESSVMSISTST